MILISNQNIECEGVTKKAVIFILMHPFNQQSKMVMPVCTHQPEYPQRKKVKNRNKAWVHVQGAGLTGREELKKKRIKIYYVQEQIPYDDVIFIYENYVLIKNKIKTFLKTP